MDSITNNQRNFRRQSPDRFKRDYIRSVIRIFVDAETIEVRLEEAVQNSLKLADVLVGPFDL